MSSSGYRICVHHAGPVYASHTVPDTDTCRCGCRNCSAAHYAAEESRKASAREWCRANLWLPGDAE